MTQRPGEYPPPPTYPEPAPRSTGPGMGTAVLVAAVALVVVACAIAAFFLLRDDGQEQARGADPVTVTTVAATEATEATATGATVASEPAAPALAPAPDPAAPADPAAGTRPAVAELPAGAVPVNAAAKNGEPAGNFNNVYRSGPTSEAFARAVRDGYVRAYLGNRELTQVIDVYSPVTGVTYSMTCRDQGSYVHCTGGNDAHVYIA